MHCYALYCLLIVIATIIVGRASDLDEFISSNCFLEGGMHLCGICGYSSHLKANVKTHIESRHVDESQRKVACDYCQYVGPSRSALRMHMKKHKIQDT